MHGDARRLLLLNTTNHPVRVAYPYAFVQVSEVARRYGIATRRVDLFGVPPAYRPSVLRRHIDGFQPDLVGITLRNTDSLLSADYTRQSDDNSYAEPLVRNVFEQLTKGAPPYFPTHDTRDVIACIRTLTQAPIVVGGFGFSTQPERLLRFLDADFGIVGDPSSLFANFEDIVSRGDLRSIDNLCYLEDGQFRRNRQVFVGPSPNREYVDEIIIDRNQFIGAVSTAFPATSRAIPVEVMRGCPYLCTFCSEPQVKGNRTQFRDLDVVLDELEFLRRHGLNLVWFVCSEINAMGNEFALELAERLIRMNETRAEAERVRWYTYYLLRFSREELAVLRRAGFLGGWNDIPAFDDANLKRLKVPYRTRHLVQSIKDIVAIREQEAAEKPASLEERILLDPEHRRSLLPEDLLTSPVLTLFLGNQYADVDTVRETLRVVDAEDLASQFEATFIIRGERVFDYNEAAPEPGSPTVSFDRTGRSAEVDYVNPTFRFSAALVNHLGSLEALEAFFTYVEDTFLSRNHLFRKDWCWFLGTTLSPSAFHGLWLQALEVNPSGAASTSLPVTAEFLDHIVRDPSLEKTGLLFFPPPGRRALASAAADCAIRFVLGSNPQWSIQLFEMLGIPHAADATPTVTEYGIASRLYARFQETAALRTEVTRAFSLERGSGGWLALADFLYRYNVHLKPEYRAFFSTLSPDRPMPLERRRRLGVVTSRS